MAVLMEMESRSKHLVLIRKKLKLTIDQHLDLIEYLFDNEIYFCKEVLNNGKTSQRNTNI